MLSIIISVLISELVGIISSFFTVDSVRTWLPAIAKPVWMPPNWLFGPVWTMLYALMGISAGLVWKKRKNVLASVGLAFYGTQLLFNFLWSVIFFGMRNPFLAFIDIIILLILIVATTCFFYKVDKKSGLLFVPYILWVSFATALNFAIWRMN